ncbi:MAG: patatin-like phospholipase family protein, partial [Candidatus Obscuribacterales bacterium]|nr:patatin-like phospholipase family protein [Candidatus Obscuribacterales bacterium]
PKAVLASLAVPPLIRPVKIDGKLYVDGGIKANLPATIARQMGASTVIAVLVDASVKPVANDSLRSIGAVVGRVTDIMMAANDKEQAKNSDILIYPNVDFIPLVTRDRSLLEKGIAAGESAADKLIPSIVQEIASGAPERSSASNGDLR